jgi:uncharacterized protein YjiS (DUF1127 family)
MLVSTLLAALHRWVRYYDSVHALSRLSDRVLDDLGIKRSNIRAVASGAVWHRFLLEQGTRSALRNRQALDARA